MNRLALSSLVAGSLLCVGAQASTPDPVRAFASDAAGNSVQTKLGEPFFVTVDFTTLNQDRPFQIKFDTAYTHLSTGAMTSGMGYRSGNWRVTWGPIVPLMSGALAVKVSFVADLVKTTSFSVTPSAPTGAVEYYGRQQLQGMYSAQWASGNGVAANWILPVPVSGGFQSVQSVALPLGSVKSVAAPFSQTVASVAVGPSSRTPSTSVQMVTTAASVRVNPALLGQTTWAKEAVGADAVWLKPETLVQSTDKTIAAFVKGALPSSYKTTLTPYATAMKLYQAVIAKLRYSTPMSGLPDAALALKTGTGDCGWFSALFVSSCRNAGIPARTVNGFTMGTGQWHVWAEFWIGGAGWVPCDPTYADGLAPNGDLPLYFGVIPELNTRVATGYGMDRTVGKVKLSMLQSPALIGVSKTPTGILVPGSSLTVASSN